MVSKAQKVRLGVFLVISFSLMLLLVVLIAGEKLLQKKDTYTIAYKNVSVNGLQIGAMVKYRGYMVGSVTEMRIDPEDVGTIEVIVEVELGTPIKDDMVANLVPQGITGLKLIELAGGSNAAQMLEPGGRIRAGTSLLGDITGGIESVTEKLEQVLIHVADITNEENQQRIANILANLDLLVADNRQHINRIMNNVSYTTSNLNELVVSMNDAMNRLNDLLYSEEADRVLANVVLITDNLSKTTEMASSITINLNNIMLKVRDDVITMIETMKETVDYLNEFSRQIDEEPSLLLRTKRK